MGIWRGSTSSTARPTGNAAVEAAWPGALGHLLAPDHGHARIAGFAPDRGGRWVVALRDRVEAEGARILAGTGVEVRVTGEAPVAYDGMNTLTRELVISTIVALGFIVVAIGLVFRSIGLALVAALPNVVPVVAGMGLYALSSDTLDPLPGLVFCIAAGLAADDTVHLINRWRELRSVAPQMDGTTAVVTALVTARTAMVSSTLVLVAGFGCLALSGFGWNRELGLLGAAVLALALVSDLVLGSAGLAIFDRVQDRRRPAHAGRGDVTSAPPSPAPAPAAGLVATGAPAVPPRRPRSGAGHPPGEVGEVVARR
ncbi:MAG TPA: MMPL family transporter [Acidimicrobiales bacterium]|nr:MMPL family transporter [Acidimicrobiales bacterium]